MNATIVTMMRSVLVSLLLVLAFTTGAFAGEHRGIGYTLPNGWKEGPGASAMVLTPPGLADGETLFVMILPATPAGDEPADKKFKAMVTLLNEDAKVLKRGQIAVRRTDNAERHQQTLWLRDKQYGKHQRLYAQAVFATTTRGFVTVVSTRDAALARHRKDVLAIIDSLRALPAVK